jgi:hypothetical protein
VITQRRRDLLHGRIDRQAAKVKREVEYLYALVPDAPVDRREWIEGIIDNVRRELRAEVSAQAAPYRSKGAS